MSTSSKGKGQEVVAGVALAHVFLFMAFWLTNSTFYSYVNDYLADLLGYRTDYISLLLGASAVLAVWSGARLILLRAGREHRAAKITRWVFGVVAVAYIIFFYGSFALLLRKSPVQWVRLGQLLDYFRIALDPIVLLGIALASGLWLRNRGRRSQAAAAGPRLLGALPALVLYVAMWTLPLIRPPSSVYRGDLPQKPMIIAHRGASMLAPENTLAAFEQASKLGVAGVEADICISLDGIPFLMHDDNLVRTTNVADIFPGREGDRSESFTLAELQQLNAGSWFVRTDPYRAVARGLVTPEEIEVLVQQRIPTLMELLPILRSQGLVFIFDLKAPPPEQPYGAQLFDLTLQQLVDAGLNQQVWFIADPDQVARIREAAPLMKPAYGVDFRHPPAASDLVRDGYQIVNAEYGLSKVWIEQYHSAGLRVNLYTIDERWQFSRLWLLGVESVTSSNAAAMVTLTRPYLGTAYPLYIALWSGIGLTGLVLMLGMVLSPQARRP